MLKLGWTAQGHLWPQLWFELHRIPTEKYVAWFSTFVYSVWNYLKISTQAADYMTLYRTRTVIQYLLLIRILLRRRALLGFLWTIFCLKTEEVQAI